MTANEAFVELLVSRSDMSKERLYKIIFVLSTSVGTNHEGGIINFHCV